MPLNRVTITGADDTTSIIDILRITERFPFVEWGILVGTDVGVRFPSKEWITTLCEARSRADVEVSLSLHCCGNPLRSICNGHSPFESHLDWCFHAFDRVQLNFHGDQWGDNSEQIMKSFCDVGVSGWDPEIICQADGVNEHQIKECVKRFAYSYLFDRSHGAGLSPDEWPQARTDAACGWAGGLGPHNLAAELPRIRAKAWPLMDYWVDMETHIRTGRVLDFAKVEQCLLISRRFILDEQSGA